MKVKIQILRDDDTLVLEQWGHAFGAFGQEFLPDLPVVEGGHALRGFCYLPVPPPRDPADVAECRRLMALAFGAPPAAP